LSTHLRLGLKAALHSKSIARAIMRRHLVLNTHVEKQKCFQWLLTLYTQTDVRITSTQLLHKMEKYFSAGKG
jgi:hypothetical protein